VTIAVPQAINEIEGGQVGDAFELSSYGATFNWLKAKAKSFAFSEYHENEPLGSMVNGIRNEDVTKLTFSDASFDIVTSNGVMEHVPQDRDGYAEIARVLRPGGRMYMTVPLYDTPATFELARPTANGIEWFGPEEYHDSCIPGPRTAVTLWRHSTADICDRVKAGGFTRVWLHRAETVPGVDAYPVIVAER
jgi:SAM-dependent methyltransferase